MTSSPTDFSMLAGRLQGPPIHISHIAFVVRDLESAIAAYTRAFGWGPWSIYEHRYPRLHDTQLRGKPAEFSMLEGETVVAGMGFELLQPLTGRSLYSEWLEEKGEGFHHIACVFKTSEEAEAVRQRFLGSGIATLMTGRIGRTISFYHLDTYPSLKLVVEGVSGDVTELAPDRIVSS